MQVMDEIIDFLQSGQWYSLKDVADGCSLPECKIGSVLKFLSYYDFIEMNEEEQKIRLNPKTRKFIYKLHETE